MYTVDRKLTTLQLLFIVHSDIIIYLIWISYKEILGIPIRKIGVEIHNIKCFYIGFICRTTTN